MACRASVAPSRVRLSVPYQLRAALMSLQKFDLGGFSVDYSGAAPFVASRYVDMGVLGANGRFAG